MDAAAALYVRDLASPLGASAAGNGVTTSSSLSSGDTNKSQNSSRPLHSKPAGLEELDSDSLEDDNPDDDALETQQQPQQHPQSQPPATSLHQPLLVVSPDPALLSLQAEWTPQEQLRLVEVLSRYPVEKHSALERYLHVAAILPNKSTRDVAHRVHSMQQLSLDGRTRAPTAEELRLRAAQQQQAAIAMSASRQPSLPTPFSRLAINRPPTPPLVPLHPNIRRLPTSVLPALPPGGLLPAARLTTLLPSAPAPVGSGSSLRSTEAAIPALMPGSATSEAADAATAAITTALDGNYVLLQSIKENMIAFNVSDNTDLLVRFRDNLLIAQLHLNSATGVLGSMPQLPVSINLDLAARFLPAAPSSTGARAMSGQLPLPVPLPSQPLHPAAQPAIPSAPSPGLDSSAAPAPAAPVQSVPGVIPVMHMPVPSFAHTGSGGLSMPGGASIPILSHAYPYTMPGTFPGLAGLPIPMPNMTAGSIPNLPAGFPTMENFFSVAMSATGGATAGSLPAFPVVPFQFPLGMPMMPQTAALALQARLMMAQGLGGGSAPQGLATAESLRAQQLQTQSLLQHAALVQQQHQLTTLQQQQQQQLARPLPQPPHLAAPATFQHHLFQQQQQQQAHGGLQASWMANPSGGAPLPVFAAPQMLPSSGMMEPVPLHAAMLQIPQPVSTIASEIVSAPLSTMTVPAPKAASPVLVKLEALG
ncbi:MAG: hypothetical protein WDW36_006107 [Sanguina aurantia]